MREDQAYALDQAIERGDTAAVGALLAGEPRLTGTPIPVARDWGEEMWLGLHRAADRGRVEIARLLLEAGASLDSRTRFRTPMHGRETSLLIAARGGYDGLVGLLLDHHADPGLMDATHRDALSHAAGQGHGAVVDRLIAHGVAVDSADDQQRTALHWAIRGGHADTAIKLIDAGADVNHLCPKEPAGFTPLHRCVSVGQAVAGVYQRLVEAGADRSLRDPRTGRTADELGAGLAG